MDTQLGFKSLHTRYAEFGEEQGYSCYFSVVLYGLVSIYDAVLQDFMKMKVTIISDKMWHLLRRLAAAPWREIRYRGPG